MKPVQSLLKVFDRINASGAEAATEGPACSGVRDAGRAAAFERRLGTAEWIPKVGCRPRPQEPALPRMSPIRHERARPWARLRYPGASKGFGGPGFAGPQFTQLSGQLQADFETLDTDQKALKAEIPANVTAAVKADQATIQKAISSLTPTQLKARRPADERNHRATIPRPT